MTRLGLGKDAHIPHQFSSSLGYSEMSSVITLNECLGKCQTNKHNFT